MRLSRTIGILGVCLCLVAFAPQPASATIDSGATSFIVDCGYIKTLKDDPIKFPGQPGVSHSHDFVANDRTTANSTLPQLENATVNLSQATESGTTGTFTFASAVTYPFTVGQQVHVQDVTGETGYNGTWTVASASTTQFTVNNMPRRLGTGSAGTAGDSQLSCGNPHGDLTYDTGSYWTPSVYVNGTRVIPAHWRIYYTLPDALAVGQNVEALPEGLQIVGGNPVAHSPADSPHLRWTCGKGSTFDTPSIDHPYDCTPFLQIPGNDIDGPVGIVTMPTCNTTGTATSYTSTVYPEQDGGADSTVCDGNNPHALVQLSIRLHFGSMWSGTMNPCGGCLAYKLSAMQETSCSSTCTGTFTVADIPEQFTVGQTIDVVSSAYPAWNSPAAGYTIASVDTGTDTFTVTGLPLGLATCPRNCGTVAGHVYTENFTIAGGEPTNPLSRPNTTHPFYSFHADFWNSWQQSQLQKLELDCIGVPPGPGGDCTGGGDVPNNQYVNALP